MPKIVDHNQRREELAQAAWRVIKQGGIEAATVRKVAEEAGMSLGSLRHYFETQSELIAFSMDLVSNRVTKRIRQTPLTGNIRTDCIMLAAQVLPLDEERRIEGEVWLAMTAKSLADPSLRILFLEVHDSLLRLFEQIVCRCWGQPYNRPLSPVAAAEARALHALIDGLAVHLLFELEGLSPETAMALVERQLDRIIGMGDQ
ncbi:TetR family transcriptional regulator C-terminal domain-containing protein [Paenibacillus pasadenensis]|uniref:TetR/AcrR family transcriptional regulator n=1 Tax=Paenibacillus pasadenensis TaxID=217090 RepID=UPI00203BE43C|nr:TetR family transcriptional regulator C-terminal domain-containing protein [Paenibacillus pasadenensis]MCM3749571.1 TetR family transcriptional regulator C-terminal domain-containing protein [Paenibacillus pasadenensis]